MRSNQLSIAAGILLLSALPVLAQNGENALSQERDIFIAVAFHNDPKGRTYQQGIEAADFVFEQRLESTESCLLAFFRPETLPHVIGPVRNVPEEMEYLLNIWPSVLLQDRPFAPASSTKVVESFGAETLRLQQSVRMPPYPPPYTLFIPGDAVLGFLDSAKTQYRGAALPIPRWSNVPPDGISATTVKISYDDANADLDLIYDEISGNYERLNYWVRQVTKPSNIVTYMGEFGEQKAVAMNALIRGRKYDGTLAIVHEELTVLNFQGEDMPMIPGQIWFIHLENEEQLKWSSPLDTHMKGINHMTTSDHTPLFISQLAPDSVYDITVRDAQGTAIIRTTDRTDRNGALLYALQEKLRPGDYKIIVRNAIGLESESFTISVLDEIIGSSLWVLAFGTKPDTGFRSKDSTHYFVGGIERSKNQVIQGYVRPLETIFAYFWNDKLLEVVAYADERGYFEIGIPLELALGEHTVRLISRLQDGTFSEDTTFAFALLPGAYEIIDYDSSIGLYRKSQVWALWLIVLLLTLHLLLVIYFRIRMKLFLWADMRLLLKHIGNFPNKRRSTVPLPGSPEAPHDSKDQQQRNQ